MAWPVHHTDRRADAAPIGSADLDTIDPTHFSTLSTIFGMPVAQFGVV